MLIFEGHDKALGVMCIDIEPCTTDDRTDFFIPTDLDRLGNTWRPGKILLDTDELSSKSDILIGAQLADDLFTTKEPRCLVHERCSRIQGVSQHQRDLQAGMSASEFFQQRQRHLLFGRVIWILGWFGRTWCGGNLLLFALFVRFIPGCQDGIWHVKRERGGQGDSRGDQQQQHNRLPIEIPTTGLVVELIGFEDAFGHFTALFVRIIYDQNTVRHGIFAKNHPEAHLQQELPGNLGVAKHPG